MKISLSNLFDTGKIIASLKEANVNGLEDFVTSLHDFTEKLLLALRNNISVGDNLDCQVKNFTLTHDKEMSIGSQNAMRLVKHIIPTRTFSFANPITSFAWEYTTAGDIRIKAKFDGNPTKPVAVTLILFY